MNTEHRTRRREPWFVLYYVGAFVFLCQIDWKLGAAWLCWRIGHAQAEAWGKPE